VVCEKCGGTGFEIVNRDGREYAQACACRRSPATGDDALLAACRIPPRYEGCSFGNFSPVTTSHAMALEKAVRYCQGYPYLDIDEGLGLLITGNNGVGKTHLAVAVLKDLVAHKKVRGQFWDFHELMREIKNSYDPETRTTELEVLSPVMQAGILVLDDLGAWRITDWMNDTLFQIVNSRYLAKRATVITSNFQDVTPEEAAKADALVRREYLVDRIGQRLRSRLVEMCLMIRIDGKDFREHKQQSHLSAVTGTSSSKPDAPLAPRPPRPRFGG
jgi:DNA replication protein DnaC